MLLAFGLSIASSASRHFVQCQICELLSIWSDACGYLQSAAALPRASMTAQDIRRILFSGCRCSMTFSHTKPG